MGLLGLSAFSSHWCHEQLYKLTLPFWLSQNERLGGLQSQSASLTSLPPLSKALENGAKLGILHSAEQSKQGLECQKGSGTQLVFSEDGDPHLTVGGDVGLSATERWKGLWSLPHLSC